VIDGAVDASLTAPDAAPDAEVAVSCQDEWIISVGGNERELAADVRFAADGGVVLAGRFGGMVDFDPGPGVAQRAAAGEWDVFVTRFGCDGTHRWTAAWGGASAASSWDDEPRRIVVDDQDNVLVAGEYCETVDFDPGPGSDVRSSNGCFDAFVSKLDASGNRVWTKAWGGAGRDRAWGIAVDPSGGTFVGGQLEGTVDLDPAPGTAMHTAVGSVDAFALSLDSNGDFRRAVAWGGPDVEFAPVDLAPLPDGSFVVVGPFRETVDFDPGPGVDERTSAGQDDFYVMRLRPDLSVDWVRTIGGSSSDSPRAVAAKGGAIYVVGSIYGPVDLDPGPGEDIHASEGLYSAFVQKLGIDGSYEWGRSWGAADSTLTGLHVAAAQAIAIAEDGRIVVGGSFQGTVDLDPSAAVDAHVSAGAYDGFAVALDAQGDRRWVRTVAGPDFDAISAVAWSDAIALAGSFGSTARFVGPDGSRTATAKGVDDVFLWVMPETKARPSARSM
jgi:hypothetical protein